MKARIAIASLMATAAMAPAGAQAQRTPAFFACGSDIVRLYESAPGQSFAPVWEWRAPPELSRDFAHIDDCKPAPGGQILVTASTGGVGLLDRSTGRLRLVARLPQAHSMALLPGGLAVVAVSVHAEGDRLAVIDLRQPDPAIVFSTPLKAAHGVVWDARRGKLYALGMDELVAYDLETTGSPRLVRKASWPTPGARNGHDLSVEDDDRLVLSTKDNVWTFDRRNGAFAVYAPLAGHAEVKSVNIDPQSGRVLYQEPEESWWAFHARLLNPEEAVATPGLNLYKARWATDEDAQTANTNNEPR